MSLIGINTEALEAIHGKLQSYHQDFEELVRAIHTEIENIPESWDGFAQESYTEQWEQIKSTTLTDVGDILYTIGVQLTDVIGIMEDTDESIAKAIKGPRA